MKKIEKNKRLEYILWMAVICVAIVLLIVTKLCGQKGAQVVVRVSGEQVASYSLDKDGIYIIEGKDGETNELVIEDGEAFVRDASCPDDLCVKSGKISKKGQSIVCLPNQVAIEVTGDRDELSDDSGDDVDAIAK